MTAATNQRFSALSIAGSGKLDPKTNTLSISYMGPSPIGSWTGASYTDLTGLIASGRIVSSSANAQTTLGIGELVGGIVTVKYTYKGDATLDGKLNIDDYVLIDSGISMGVAGWSNGDFNYDGKVNIDDYTILDTTITDQGLPL